MGFIPEDVPATGEYSVEVRSESFYLRGEDSYEGKVRHGIHLYPSSGDDSHNQGSCEILIEDIDKIRACLDTVEWHHARGDRGSLFDGISAAFEVVFDADDPVILARVRTRAQAEELARIAGEQEPWSGQVIVREIPLETSPRLAEALALAKETEDLKRHQRELALRSRLANAIASGTEISFVLEFQDHVASAGFGHRVTYLDLENDLLGTDSLDDREQISKVRLLHEGRGEAMRAALERLEEKDNSDPTIAELEAELDERLALI